MQVKKPNQRKRRFYYLSKLTDAKLVKYIRRGNNHAFDVLIRRHEVKVKYILRVNLFDKSQVDDTSQDVWEMVVHHFRSRSYKETGQFYGWLSTIAFRKATDVNRQKLYNPETVVYDPLLHDEEDTVQSDSPSEQILEEAKKIIATFSDRDREIIRIHYDERLSFEVIARQMKMPSGMVRKYHSRSIKKLRDRLLV